MSNDRRLNVNKTPEEIARARQIARANSMKSVRLRRRAANREHELDTADVRALALAEELIARAADEGMSVSSFLQREAAELGEEP